MPTERFYRLPAGKREVICGALRKEFARVPYEKASINQMIRNASISRGSFYTYFYDKDDAAGYVLEDSYLKIRQVCEQALAENGGDFLNMLQALFDYLVGELHTTKETMDIARNVLFIHDNDELIPECDQGLEGSETVQVGSRRRTEISLGWMLEKVNTERLRIRTRDELSSLLALGANALIHSVRQYFDHPDQIERIRALFESKLDVLRDGAYKV